MKEYIEERVINIANYIIQNSSTVRRAAKEFHISKSTAHKDATERLSKINSALAESVAKVLNENKSQRHIRGGLATKNKYMRLKEESKKM